MILWKLYIEQAGTQHNYLLCIMHNMRERNEDKKYIYIQRRGQADKSDRIKILHKRQVADRTSISLSWSC